MKQNNRLRGRRIGIAVASAAVIIVGGAASAPSAFASPAAVSATAYSATPSSAVHPATAALCFNFLNQYGYTVTTTRGLACEAVANAGHLGHTVQAMAIAACIGTMKVTGVTAPVSIIVCNAAAVPG